MIKRISMLVFSVLLWSCGGLKPVVTHDLSPLGTWVLVSRSGGLAGTTTTFDAAHRESVLQLEQDRMIRWEKGQKISEQSYVIEPGKVIESAEPQDILKAAESMPQSLMLKDGQLILRGQCYDCYTDRYQRFR
ncbi:hypothetical protein [Flavobacterium sp. JP2137]|uniref:hypothetical protein n=1 Tax=Flavobacterium sp. JP2137 TaxID=3414510 RepID=UPI003D2FA4F9